MYCKSNITETNKIIPYYDFRVTYTDIICFILVMMLVFQNPITDAIHLFQYFDEILALGVFFIGFTVKRGRFTRFDLICIALLAGFELMGWLSYILYQYQSPGLTMMGGLLQIKFFLLMFGTKWIVETTQKREKISSSLHDACIISMWLLFILNVLTYLRDETMYLVPWDTCGKVVFLIAGVLMTFRKNKIEYLSLAIGIIMLIATGKAKAYGAVALLIALYVWVLCFKKKIKIWEIAVLGVILVIAAWEKIHFYYIQGAGKFARSVLTLTGIKIANDYFPFGTGFSSYASYGAATEYSPVYYLYEISKHHELGLVKQSFLNDTYWPSVMGETGWLGMILLGTVLIYIYTKIQRLHKIDIDLYCCGMFVLVYMIITTFEETGFMQPVLLGLGIMLGGCLTFRKPGLESQIDIEKSDQTCLC